MRNKDYPKWYLEHRKLLKKKMNNEISDKEYWKLLEGIRMKAGLSYKEYVDAVFEYDPEFQYDGL